MIGLGRHPRWSRVGTQVCLGLLRLSIKFSVSAETLLLKTLNENGSKHGQGYHLLGLLSGSDHFLRERMHIAHHWKAFFELISNLIGIVWYSPGKTNYVRLTIQFFFTAVIFSRHFQDS